MSYDQMKPKWNVLVKTQLIMLREPFSSGHKKYYLHTYEVVSMDMCAKFHDLAMMISLFILTP